MTNSKFCRIIFEKSKLLSFPPIQAPDSSSTVSYLTGTTIYYWTCLLQSYFVASAAQTVTGIPFRCNSGEVQENLIFLTLLCISLSFQAYQCIYSTHFCRTKIHMFWSQRITVLATNCWCIYMIFPLFVT